MYGQIPIALQRSHRNTQGVRGLGLVQSAKEAQFDDFGSPFIERLQTVEGLVDGQQPLIESDHLSIPVPKIESFETASSLFTPYPAGMVHQHTAQLLRGDCQEMRAIFPVRRCRAG